MLNNSLDPLSGFLLTVAVMVLVICILLWRGRRLAQLRSRAGKPLLLMPPPGSMPAELTVDSLEEPPPHHQRGWPAAIQEINRHLTQCRHLLSSHKHQSAEKSARSALSLAFSRLTREHWLVGLSLEKLSQAEAAQGRHYDALQHLEAAIVILSEWPQHDAYVRDTLRPRVAGCRRMLGFDQGDEV